MVKTETKLFQKFFRQACLVVGPFAIFSLPAFASLGNHQMFFAPMVSRAPLTQDAFVILDHRLSIVERSLQRIIGGTSVQASSGEEARKIIEDAFQPYVESLARIRSSIKTSKTSVNRGEIPSLVNNAYFDFAVRVLHSNSFFGAVVGAGTSADRQVLEKFAIDTIDSRGWSWGRPSVIGQYPTSVTKVAFGWLVILFDRLLGLDAAVKVVPSIRVQGLDDETEEALKDLRKRAWQIATGSSAADGYDIRDEFIELHEDLSYQGEAKELKEDILAVLAEWHWAEESK